MRGNQIKASGNKYGHKLGKNSLILGNKLTAYPSLKSLVTRSFSSWEFSPLSLRTRTRESCNFNSLVSHAAIEKRFNLRKRLSAGTVPVNKKHLTGTVPTNKEHLTGTVPVNKEHLTGTLYIFRVNEGEMLMAIS